MKLKMVSLDTLDEKTGEVVPVKCAVLWRDGDDSTLRVKPLEPMIIGFPSRLNETAERIIKDLDLRETSNSDEAVFNPAAFIGENTAMTHAWWWLKESDPDVKPLSTLFDTDCLPACVRACLNELV